MRVNLVVEMVRVITVVDVLTSYFLAGVRFLKPRFLAGALASSSLASASVNVSWVNIFSDASILFAIGDVWAIWAIENLDATLETR